MATELLEEELADWSEGIRFNGSAIRMEVANRTEVAKAGRCC